MTVSVTRTADHTVAVATLMESPGDGGKVLPSWLATSAGAETGLVGAPLYVAPGTSAQWTIVDGGGSITVDGSVTVSGTVAATQSGTWNITNISGTVSLPTGAATAAKQPALGVAGTASADVITVQGVAGMTAVKVDGSAVTQPVSGTVSAAQSGTWTVQPGNTANTTAWLVTGTGGTFPATQSGTWTVGLSASQTLATVTTVTTLSTLSGGGVAHDGVDSGNPVKVGAKALSALSSGTMVASGDRTDLTSDLDAAVIVRNQFPLGDLTSERVTDTGGTSTAFSNFGATASTRNYITAISVYNSSATAGYVDFRDGTAGSVLFTVALPAGGGAVMACDVPLFRTSANTALAYDVSGALSTVYISVSGFRSKV